MLRLFERIQSLRLLAAAVYDRAKAKGLAAEQTKQYIKPLIDELDAEVAEAVRSRVSDCVQALYQLEQLAHVHRAEAKRQVEKADDIMTHVARLKDALQERMEREGVTSLREGDSMVILNRVNGQSHVTYR